MSIGRLRYRLVAVIMAIAVGGHLILAASAPRSAFATPSDNGGHDTLWRSTTGDVQIWFMNGTTIASMADVGVVSNSLSIAGVGDFSGIGHGNGDIVWLDTSSGDLQISLMSGATVTSTVDLGAVLPPSFSIVGIGDFNGDGQSDILWRNASGDVQITLLNGTTDTSTVDLGTTMASFSVVGIGDFNGDGKSDILWRSTTGDVQIWLMNGTNILATADLGVVLPPSFSVVGIGDFNGDGKSDILWLSNTGDPQISLINGTTVTSTVDLGTSRASFSVGGIGDFNGDGKSDILWRNASGDLQMWLMNGTNILATADLGVFSGSLSVHGTVAYPANFTLTASDSGNGSGTVTSSPAGINCPATCSASFPAGPSVTLTASAAAGSSFSGWNGAGCSGAGTCVVPMSTAQGVTATFTVNPSVLLSVAVGGTGSGAVTSNLSGINCPGACSAGYAQGSQVVLTAAPASGSTFAGWSGGGCSGTSPCTVTMSAAENVSATFTATTETLTVTENGTGAGQVTSNPAGINCSATSNQCAAPFAFGATVTLTASASAGSSFAGWSGGGCSGTGTCQVTMNAAQSVTATFNVIPSFMLSVVPSGTGSGTVTSNPSGINCGSTCNASFQQGTQVTLTASAASGSTFAGWSGGGCGGTETCSVTLTANTAVAANFTQNTAANLTLVAAVLPTSRSVQVGHTATAFATMIDAGPSDAATCTITPQTSIPASFVFQTTNPATNALTGTPNTPANIAAGQAQSFVIALTPTAAFPPTNVAFTFTCADAPSPAATTIGVDTLNLSGSTTPVPDVVALAASGDPGFVDIAGATGTGVFAVATVNLGVDATITAAANTGTANLPVTLAVCQTNPQSGACLASPAPSATADIPPDATPTFGVFVTGSAAVADLPGVNRVFVTFTDANGVLRGETSVAVRTQ